jgi:hypothetical protein
MTRLEHTAELEDALPGAGAAPAASAVAGPNLDPDEELLALPAPPRRERLMAMTLMAAVVGLALGLGASLRADVSYFLTSGLPVDLGKAPALDPSGWQSNLHARVRGTPMLSRMVRYHGALGGNGYVVFPLAGQRNLLVQVPAEGLDDAGALPTEFAGRLLRVGDLGGRYASVAGFLRERMELPLSADTYLLMAEEPPGSYLWACLLLGLCLGVVALNIWLMLRWFRPLKW